MENNQLTGAKHSDILFLRKVFRLVMKYVVFCHQKMQEENKEYSKSKWIPTSKHKRFEDHLKNSLVDEYLRKETYRNAFCNNQLNIVIFNNSITDLFEAISFGKETTEEYKDTSNKTGDNKNDIYVQILQLSRSGKNSFEEDNTERFGEMIDSKSAWFQIECKILDNSHEQYSGYIEDIVKFLDREYKIEWMPFGGQIAFVKNGKMDTLYTKINEKLTKKTDIKTSQALTYFEINTTFPYSYQSIHTHRLGHKFDIYHLLLDYRNLIKD